jgi:amidase
MKDLGPGVKGRLQEQGSAFLRGNRPAEDAFLTTQIRHAGLNIIGRSATPEFGVCGSAENPAIYVTRSPWNPQYTTFGSSAGACTSVAAGIIPSPTPPTAAALSAFRRGQWAYRTEK